MDYTNLHKSLKQYRKVLKEERSKSSIQKTIAEQMDALIESVGEYINEAEVNAVNSTLTLEDLNRKYAGKYLRFPQYEEGEDNIFVKNIHVKDGEIVVDGTLLQIYDEGRSIGMGIFHDMSFNNFPCMRKYDKGGAILRYTSCDVLDEKLTKGECLIERDDVINGILLYVGSAFARESDDDEFDKLIQKRVIQNAIERISG